MSYGWYSNTRMLGLAAFLLAASLCGFRWAKAGPGGLGGRVFACLFWVQVSLLCDMAFDLRWKLHSFAMREAMRNGVYDLRSTPQTIALVLLGCGVGVACGWVMWRFRRRSGAALAIAGTIGSLGLWCTETVSLHGVDAVFYRSAGGVRFVSLLWVGLSLITCVGAWTDYRSDKPS